MNVNLGIYLVPNLSICGEDSFVTYYYSNWFILWDQIVDIRAIARVLYMAYPIGVI
jgi:hypothetical protein